MEQKTRQMTRLKTGKYFDSHTNLNSYGTGLFFHNVNVCNQRVRLFQDGKLQKTAAAAAASVMANGFAAREGS